MPTIKKVFDSLNDHPLYKKNSNLNKSLNLDENLQANNEPLITITDYSSKNIKSNSISNLIDKPFNLNSSIEFLFPKSNFNKKGVSMSQNNLVNLANIGYLQPIANDEYLQQIQKNKNDSSKDEENQSKKSHLNDTDDYLRPFPLPEYNSHYLSSSDIFTENTNFSIPTENKYLNSLDIDDMAVEKKFELINNLINDLENYLLILKILDEEYLQEIKKFNLKALIDISLLENIFSILNELQSLIKDKIIPQLYFRNENKNKKNANQMVCDIFVLNIEKLKLYDEYIERLETFLKDLHKSSRFTQFKQLTIMLDKKIEKKYPLSHIRYPFKKTFLSFLTYVINFPNLVNQFLIAYENFISIDSYEFKYYNEIIECFNEMATKSIERMENTKNIEAIANIQRRIGSKHCITNKKRSLIKEGILFVLSPFFKKIVKKYMFLLNDLLIICDFRNNDIENLDPKKPIDIRGMSVSNDVNEFITGKPEKLPANPYSVSDEQNGFTIHIPSILKVFRFFTRNMTEKKNWVEAFDVVCQANKFSIDRASIGKIKPKLLPKNLFPYCFKCKSEFTTVIRRHHCKACGYVFCVSCSRAQLKLEYDENINRVCDLCYDFIQKTFRSFPPTSEQIMERSRSNFDLNFR